MAVDRKGKYQPWNHEAFVGDPRVRRMTPLARKTYMTLLHEAFVCSVRPYLPDDEHELEILADCASPAEWQEIRPFVLSMFQKVETEDGPRLANKRLLQDWETLLDIREKRSEAGKASGAARKAKLNTCEHVLEQVEQVKRSKEKRSEVNLSEETEETDMKSEKQITTLCQQIFGRSARLYDTHKSELKRLDAAYKGSAVIRAFEEWGAEHADEDYGNPVAVFLTLADDLLGEESTSQKAAKAPEVQELSRALAYLSDGKVAFRDREKAGLQVLGQEYAQQEIEQVFKTWLADQDLSDPRVLQYAAKNFVECADALCYTARRKKLEKSESDTAREAAKTKLQAEAEAERAQAEAQKSSEEQLFDPLA